MKPAERIVTEIPMSEMWNSEGALEAHRAGLLSREDVRRLVQQGVVRFAVADVGHPLRWIPAEDRYVFWKEEIKPHIVDQPEGPIDVYSYPHGYAYVASEWHPSDALEPSIVLLEKYH